MKKSKSKKESPQNKPEECCSGLAVFGGITLTLLVLVGLVLGVRYLINVHPEENRCYRNSGDSAVFAKVFHVYNDNVSYVTIGGWLESKPSILERSIESFQDRYDKEVDCSNYNIKDALQQIDNLQDRVYSLEHRSEERYYINGKPRK